MAQSNVSFMLSAEYVAKFPEFSNGGPENKADPASAVRFLGLVYGGFPEQQKASWERGEAEAQKVEQAMAPFLHDGFEPQLSESLRKPAGGLVLTNADSLTSGKTPRVYTATDGSACTLTDEPWNITFQDVLLAPGQDMGIAGGPAQRTVRLDYTTTFNIKCAEGSTLAFTQPKHLSFVEQGGEWLNYEYGRSMFTDAITPAA